MVTAPFCFACRIAPAVTLLQKQTGSSSFIDNPPEIPSKKQFLAKYAKSAK
jgi:hypothetical protein